MLVLTRKENQKVVIGGNIVVTINRISGNRITLGIEAPKDVRVVRGELEVNSDELSQGLQGLSIEITDGSALDSEDVPLPRSLADRIRSTRGDSNSRVSRAS